MVVANIPILANGDRLTRAEFERRYHAMPHLKKAELIEGVVYMPSPVRFNKHSEPHGYMVAWLVAYKLQTPFVAFGNDATVRLDMDNEPQPDALLRLEPKVGGTSSVSADDYIEGPPELVVEIASSTASYDLHDKLHAYRRNGVKEYLVWRVEEGAFDWFVLDEGRYVRLEPTEGTLESRTFPGLVLHVDALLEDDMQVVMMTLQNALKSETHERFVERLGAKAST